MLLHIFDQVSMIWGTLVSNQQQQQHKRRRCPCKWDQIVMSSDIWLIRIPYLASFARTDEWREKWVVWVLHRVMFNPLLYMHTGLRTWPPEAIWTESHATFCLSIRQLWVYMLNQELDPSKRFAIVCVNTNLALINLKWGLPRIYYS